VISFALLVCPFVGGPPTGERLVDQSAIEPAYDVRDPPQRRLRGDLQPGDSIGD
jgi:hypothetical protein